MKRIVKIMIAAMLMCALTVSSAFAASAFDTAVTKDGSTVSVAFKVNKNDGFRAYQADIDYDKNALELVSITEGAVTAGKGIGTFTGNKDAAFASFYATVADSAKDTGVLFTANFKVKDGAANGDYKVSLKNFKFGDRGSMQTYDGVAGVVKVHSHKYGDWKYDENNHWKECSCGDVKDKAKHDMKWTVVEDATVEKEGLKEGVCSVCGYEAEKVIDKLVPEKEDPTKPTDKPEDPTKPADKPEDTTNTGDESNMMVFGIVALAAAAVATGTVFTRRKSAK